MTFSTQRTMDQAVFYNTTEFAESITYTPVGGVAVTISAVVDRSGPQQELYVRGPTIAICTIHVKTTDVTTPQWGDKYTFDSADWRMDPELGVIYQDDYDLEIALERMDSA